MIIKIIRYLNGYLRIRITGYSPERFLNLCSHHHICLWGLKPCGHAYEMYITLNGFRKLKPILRKTKMKVSVRQRIGLPFFLHRYRKRKIFFAGALLCLILIYGMSLCIWNIHIDGNYSRTVPTLLEFLESRNVRHGMPKKDVDCSRIVKDIRAEYDDIIWVSASIQGTRLIIRIKENMDTMPEEQEESNANPSTEPDTGTSADHLSPPEAPTDLVADIDGTVTKIITRKGVPQVEPGSQVKKGDLLVSGQVPVLNDSKEIVNYQYHIADADIFIRTEIPYENKLPLIYQKKNYTGKKRYFPYLTFGNFHMKTTFPKNTFKNYDIFRNEYQLKLGENFYLPVSFGLETAKSYTFSRENYTKEEIQTILSADFERFCADLKKKGVQILENNVRIYKDNGYAVARGRLIVITPTGETVKPELIPVENKDETKGEE